MSIHFSPSYNPCELFDYASNYGHTGKKKFFGSWDEEKYFEFSEYVKTSKIPHDVWPYHTIEEDFYSFNTLGYRTYEFSELHSGEFDLTIGCSYVEGLGLRQTETWIHHYENCTNLKLVNLGKSGGTNTSIKFSLISWLLGNYPRPRKIIILWTEPSRDTYIRYGGAFANMNPGWDKIHHILHESDDIINLLYKTSIQHNLIWSNRFIETFTTVNLFAKGFNIPLYNFFPDIFWENENVETVRNKTNFSGKLLNFTNPLGGWAKFKTGNFYPASDGVHHGWQHQIPIAKQIFENTV